MHRICIFVVLVSWAIWADAGKQQVALRPFMSLRDLPSYFVRQVYEDTDGVIWFATSRGLTRYADGSIRVFRSNLYTPELLPSNNVICVCEDKRQRLWIATEDGLGMLDKRTGRIEQIPLPDMQYRRVNDLLVNRDGKVFAGTIRGLMCYDESLRRMVKIGLDDVNIQSLAEMPNGDLLVGTWRKGIYKYSVEKGIETVPLSDAIVSKTIFDIHYDKFNRLWIGTMGEGLCQISVGNDNKWEVVAQYLGNDLHANCVNAIAEGDGHLYYASRNGLYIDGNADMLPGEEVLGVCIDSNGYLWAATKGSGIFTSAPSSEGQSESAAQSFQVIIDHDNNRWEAHNYGVKYQPAASSQSVMLLPALRPYKLSLTSDGRVLIPTHDAGLYVAYKGKIERHFSRKGGTRFIPHDLVHHAIKDSKGNLWVATRLGIGVRLGNGREYVLTAPPDSFGIVKEEAYFLAEDHSGTVWAAIDDGVIRCDSTFRRYSVENRKFPLGAPTSFCQDQAGRLWVGTDGMGLCLYDKKHDCFMSVHERLQLPGDIVTDVREDADGTLLVNTGTEEIRLSPKELTVMHRLPNSNESNYWRFPLIIVIVIICLSIGFGLYKKIRHRRTLRSSCATENDDAKCKSEPDLHGREECLPILNHTVSQEFVGKATVAVRLHMSDCDFDVVQLADILAVSRTTLHRKLKDATGLSTTAFIRSIRLQTACQILLSSPDIRVSDLAYKVGFNDPKYFSQCFKVAYGVLPGEYTRSNHVAK